MENMKNDTTPKWKEMAQQLKVDCVRSEILEECIMDLPTNADLHPITDAESAYMTHINGDPNRNGSVKKFSATVELTYTVYQKKLVVVTTSSIEGTDPVLQEVGGRFNRSIRFTSNSENGDMYAGQKLTREYFYSNEKGATDDAMRRAKAWLQQKRSVVCSQ